MDFLELIEYLDKKFAQIPTKEYMEARIEARLIELESKLFPLPKKAHARIDRLTEILVNKNVLTESEANELHALDPGVK